MSGFFSRGNSGQQPDPRQQPPRGPYDRVPDNDGYGAPSGYGRQPPGHDRSQYGDEKSFARKGLPSGPRMGGGMQASPGRQGGPGGRGGDGGQVWRLTPAKSPNNQYTFGNMYDGHNRAYSSADRTLHPESPSPHMTFHQLEMA